MVHPSVPWPVFRKRLENLVLPMIGVPSGVMGRSPVQAVEDPELSASPVRAHAGSGVSIAGPDARLRREEVARITAEVLAELPEIFRTVLVLREFEDLSYQQMADVLGISIGTVESRLFRARARFKEAMIRLHPEFAAPD